MKNKYVYVYESHIGGYFLMDEELSPEEEYCETCGDSDNLAFSGYPEDILHELEENIELAKKQDEECESNDGWYEECAIIDYNEIKELLEKYNYL